MIRQKKKSRHTEELLVKDDRKVTGERAIGALLQAASDDEGLLVRVRSAKTAAELVKIGASVGYQFTVADLQAAKVKANMLRQAMNEIYQLLADESVAEEIDRCADAESIVEIGAKKGYQFTARDFQLFLEKTAQEQVLEAEKSDEFDDYELNEDELEMVAGGRRRVQARSYWHDTGIQLENGENYYVVQADGSDFTSGPAEVRAQIIDWFEQGYDDIDDLDGNQATLEWVLKDDEGVLPDIIVGDDEYWTFKLSSQQNLDLSNADPNDWEIIE